MKQIVYFDTNGQKKLVQEVRAIHKEPGRTVILMTFAQNPEFTYFETNVRRYTSGDVYAGHRGRAI